MKANNLTVSVNTPKCTKSCPFCISKMTGEISYNEKLYWRNLDKVKALALSSGITSVLITGKGEPMDNLNSTLRLISYFDESNISVELQTNGVFLYNKYNNLINVNTVVTLSTLYKRGLNVLAVSIQNPKELLRISTGIRKANELNLVTRLTIVLGHDWKDIPFETIRNYCINNNISQLTFRIPTIPDNATTTNESLRTQEWIEAQEEKYYQHILKESNELCNEKTLIRTLSFGAAVHDISGIGVTTMNYCIQESTQNDDIRSLIYQTDGHLYTTWDKKGSILF